MVRELGSERRETVRSLSTVVIDFFNFCLSTKGPDFSAPIVNQLFIRSIVESLRAALLTVKCN